MLYKAILRSLVGAGLLFTAVAAHAQTEFVVVKAKLDQVMQPQNAGDVVMDCASNSACRSLLDKAAQLVGAPAGAVSTTLALFPKAERSGEEGNYKFALPSGYQYCRSEIQTVSVVPATGDRASVMSASSDQTGVNIYTWTPRQGFGGGRSWVEANFTIVGVSDGTAAANRASGKCRPVGQSLINCRGATGTNHGMPSCGTVSD